MVFLAASVPFFCLLAPPALLALFASSMRLFLSTGETVVDGAAGEREAVKADEADGGAGTVEGVVNEGVTAMGNMAERVTSLGNMADGGAGTCEGMVGEGVS